MARGSRTAAWSATCNRPAPARLGVVSWCGVASGESSQPQPQHTQQRHEARPVDMDDSGQGRAGQGRCRAISLWPSEQKLVFLL